MRMGKFFPPDPSSGNFCTIGGMISNNSAGLHSIKYGATKDYVISLKGVLSNGEVFRSTSMETFSGQMYGDICAQLKCLLEENKDLISKKTPRSVQNSSGYNLSETLKDGKIDLNKLLAGSEGTLAIITEATLRILDLPAHRALAVISFEDLEKTSEAILKIREENPSALELLDPFLIDLIQEQMPKIHTLIPADMEALLLVEFDGNEGEEVREKMRTIQRSLVGISSSFKEAMDAQEQERLWQIRKATSPIINRVKGSVKPLKFIEDVAVEPEHLALFFRTVKKILRNYGVSGAIFGHAGTGNLHINPWLDVKDPNYKEKIKGIMNEVYELTLNLQGTISAEHGDGILRANFVRKMYEEIFPVFDKIKSLFDPKGILNPGKIINHDAEAYLKNLRYDSKVSETNTPFDQPSIKEEVEKCHGCGTCRSYCPVAIETKDEKATARAKANLLRAVISGKLSKDKLRSIGFKEIMDLCFNCKNCLIQCPTRIDIPSLCIEAKAIYSEGIVRNLKEKIFANPSFMELGYYLVPLSNKIMKNGFGKRMLEMLAGIDSRRNFPTFHRHRSTADDVERERRMTNVIYFPGCFARFFDPAGEFLSTLKVLRSNGVQAKVLPFKCCGVANITLGHGNMIIPNIKYNLNLLKPYIDEGYKIITSSASCGLTLKQDYPKLVPTALAEKVAKNTYDVHEYLIKLHREGKLIRKFNEVYEKIGFHMPCHLMAQGINEEPLELLSMIPGLELREIEDSCCGMAGTFGLKKKFFDLSMNIGRRLFEEIGKAKPDIMVTSCGACKLQLEQGTGLKVLHTMDIIKWAVGGERA